MAVRIGQSKKKRELISEINVTPFVDVMLVLLVIFMITAPLLTTGIKINLPESTAKVISEKKEPVTVSIKKNGEIFLQKKKINKDELIKKLFELKKLNDDLKIYIRGDKDLNYGQVINLMGTINKAGFKKVALVTKLK
ncbi:MAG: protein TolR [Rickettsiales bacterium]|nr:protein TolR [Rickettsiales bacterium]